MQEQVDLCEISAPTFQEEKRADELVKRMKQYGLTDVCKDGIGNVLGRRKGKTGAKTIAIGAHMDSVFPARKPTLRFAVKEMSIGPQASVIIAPA